MNCKHGFAIGLFFFARSLFAQTNEDLWLRDAALQSSLTAPVAVQSANEPLRIFLTRLSRSQRVAYFLDRRIDPCNSRDFAQRNLSLRSTFFSAAANAGGGSCLIGDVVYVGPGTVAAALPDLLATLRDEIRKLPPDAKKNWQRNQALQIPRLAKPVEFIAELALANGLSLAGSEAIEHDVWPQIDLPPLSLAERFVLMLVGFNKWPKISADGKSVRIVDVPLPTSITRNYTYERRNDFTEWLQQTIPEAKAQLKSAGVVVTATPSDHHEIGRWLAEHEVSRIPRNSGAKKVVTLNATASAGKIARQVAMQLGVEFQCEARLEKKLEAQVEIHVDQVSYHELLTQVFADTGLSFQLDERQLRVFSK